MLGRGPRRAAGVAILALAVLAAPAAGRSVEDCVAAVVNGKAITLVDVRIALRFGLHAGDPAETSAAAVRDRLVEQRLVLDLARGTAPGPGDAEVAAEEETARRRLGAEGWARALAELGLAESDLRPFLREAVLFRSTLASRFGQAAPVTLREIEDHYARVYVPAEKAAGAEPAPLVQVIDRLESLIQEGKRARLVADWIGNLRAQAEVLVNADCLD